MKKILIIIIVFSFTTAYTQDFIIVDGVVVSENTGAPVPNQSVFLVSGDSSYFNTVLTDLNGYFIDSIFSPISGGLYVSTFDCNGEKHFEYIQYPGISNYVQFEICTDSCDIAARFSFVVDSLNELLVYFTDLSTGNNISQWIWDFGNGNFSYNQNPSHLYSEAGTYTVSLMVSDSLGLCFDEITQEIIISDSMFCVADFDVELDTIANVPYVYRFFDKSEGNIISWSWDFGDSTFSNEQSPVHTYADSGTYQVCLTVQSDDSIGFCKDTYCVLINTPSYYNFGGQVFAGDYPINIEENDSSNRAVAYLYRHYKGLWRLVDQREFWRFGYYWFVNKLEGDYIIKVELKGGSPLYNEYAQSYFGNKIFWQKSNLFELKNSEVFDVNINLRQLSFLQIGTGSVSGMIYQTDSCVVFKKNHVPIYLFYQDKLASVKYTDDEGFYYFDDLPYGNYKITADLTGMFSDVIDFAIDTQHQAVDTVEIGLSCSNPDFIFTRKNISLLKIENIFPVPADKSFSVELFSKYNTGITVSLIDITGKTVKTFEKKVSTGKNLFMLPVSGIPGGLYMIKIQEPDKNTFAGEKIIIKH